MTGAKYWAQSHQGKTLHPSCRRFLSGINETRRMAGLSAEGWTWATMVTWVNTGTMEENKKKEKTKHITFDKLNISEYLKKNKNTNISKTIFKIRAGTFYVKTRRKWEYQDNLCVACQEFEETMDHFMKCKDYKQKKKYEKNGKKS